MRHGTFLTAVPHDTETEVVGHGMPVFVQADDALASAGVTSVLRSDPAIDVVDGAGGAGPAEVVVLVADTVDRRLLDDVATAQRHGERRVVVVIGRLDTEGLLTLTQAGASAVLRRQDTTGDRLLGAVHDVRSGAGHVPADLLGELLGELRRRRTHLSVQARYPVQLSDREIAVLRLAADGLDTVGIAKMLCWSERTVKNVVHDVTVRLHLRNRTHAVAVAIREGLI